MDASILSGSQAVSSHDNAANLFTTYAANGFTLFPRACVGWVLQELWESMEINSGGRKVMAPWLPPCSECFHRFSRT